MNPEVKEKAEALAQALAESEEFEAFQNAREELDKHEAAKIMLRDFQQKQAALQQKVMQGQNPTEPEVQALQEAYQLVTFNPYVRKVVEAEANFSELLAMVQKTLAEAVGMEVPEEEGEGKEEVEGGQAEQGKRPPEEGSGPSRLWVPGR